MTVVQVICPHCNFTKTVSQEKIPPGARWANCPRCRQRFELFPAEVPSCEGFTDARESEHHVDEKIPGSQVEKRKTAWENRVEIGLWKGIYETFKEVLFSPQVFFGSLAPKGGYGEPLAYAILVGSIGGMLGLFWQFLMFSGGVFSFAGHAFQQSAVFLIFIAAIFVIPIAVVICTFFYSGILHMLLLLTGGAQRGYEATFRVVSYSQAAKAWAMIPFLGSWIGWIWQVVVQVIGLREIHKTSYPRVIIAFLIPVGLLFVMTAAALIFLVYLVTRHVL